MALLVMTGHINVMLVLQSCTDPLHILPSSSSMTYTTSYNISNIKFKEEVDVKEEGFIAFNEEVDIDIKKEEIPEDINAVPDEVSYVFICVLLDTFYQCLEILVVFVISVVLAN